MKKRWTPKFKKSVNLPQNTSAKSRYTMSLQQKKKCLIQPELIDKTIPYWTKEIHYNKLDATFSKHIWEAKEKIQFVKKAIN